MNNEKLYKASFSGVRHSDEAIERIFDMTVNNKKRKVGFTIRRLATVALALVLIIGGGFGINAAANKKAAPDEPGVIDELGVMVAYAGEKTLLKADSANEQKLFYKIYVADIDNDDECYRVKNEWGNDKADQLELAANADSNISGCVKSGYTTCYSSKEDRDTAQIYTLSAGRFALNLESYSGVESITIENSSTYGEVRVDYAVEVENDINIPITTETGHQITLTRQQLDYSVDSGYFRMGTGSGEVNKGYDIYWDISENLRNEIGNNLDFDFTQIKDTLTFKVEYTDKSIETASISISFDANGNMLLGKADN